MANRPMSRGDVVAREIAVGGLAGLVAGVLVAGIGGRIFMRLAALIDPSAAGLLTSNGNEVGQVTLVGTVAFVALVGPLFGAAAGVLWVAVSPWLPGRGIRRALAAGAVGASITPFFVVRAAEPDFQLLGPANVVVALVIGLAGIVGVAVALLDERLDARLSQAPSSAMRTFYRLFTLIGLIFVPLAVAGYFSSELPGFRPPVEVGWTLLVVGATTAAWWIFRARQGTQRPPWPLVLVGRGALSVAVVLGVIKVASEVGGILALTG